MVSIALTGNVAAGKSVVADILEAGGVPVLRADALARDAVVPGSPALAEIRREFGPEVLDDEGRLDRAGMRSLVFEDERLRHRLEAILHPHIRRMREAWVSRKEAEGADVVVTEIPLLYELDLAREFDAVVLVHASPEARERRLVETRGLESADAAAMMAAQGDPEAKIARADRVIRNDGSLAELEASADALLEDIRAGRFP